MIARKGSSAYMHEMILQVQGLYPINFIGEKSMAEISLSNIAQFESDGSHEIEILSEHIVD